MKTQAKDYFGDLKVKAGQMMGVVITKVGTVHVVGPYITIWEAAVAPGKPEKLEYVVVTREGWQKHGSARACHCYGKKGTDYRHFDTKAEANRFVGELMKKYK